MSKRYAFTTDNQLIIYEQNGIKKIVNPIPVKPIEEFLYNEFYEWYMKQLQQINYETVSLKEIESVRKMVIKKAEEIKHEEIAYIDGKIYTKNSIETAEDLRQVISSYHKKNHTGSYHSFYENRQWIRKGQLLLLKTEKIPNIYYTQKRNSFVKNILTKWKEEMSCYYSEWELENILWVLSWCRVNEIKRLPKWIQNEYGERGDYFPYFWKKEIEKILFYEIIQNK